MYVGRVNENQIKSIEKAPAVVGLALLKGCDSGVSFTETGRLKEVNCRSLRAAERVVFASFGWSPDV